MTPSRRITQEPEISSCKETKVRKLRATRCNYLILIPLSQDHDLSFASYTRTFYLSWLELQWLLSDQSIIKLINNYFHNIFWFLSSSIKAAFSYLDLCVSGKPRHSQRMINIFAYFLAWRWPNHLPMNNRSVGKWILRLIYYENNHFLQP